MADVLHHFRPNFSFWVVVQAQVTNHVMNAHNPATNDEMDDKIYEVV